MRTITLPDTFPTIVCLCGSTRFMQAFQEATLNETLAGNIVLSIGCNTKSDEMLNLPVPVKEALDTLHKRKIDLADEILVLNVNGYMGDSTRSEIAYAMRHGKTVRYLDPQSLAEQYRQFLEDTVDDPEYNAYLEYRDTPKPENY